MTDPEASSSPRVSLRSIARIAGTFGIRRAETALFALISISCVSASIAAAPNSVGILGSALAIVMLTIAFIDARHFIIPDTLNAVGFGLALLHAIAQEPEAMLWAVSHALMRGAALALVFWIIREVYMRVRGRDGLGLGDVKLAGVAGAWLDWLMMPIVIETAALAALSVYMLRYYFLAHSISATTRLPLGLFFAPAIWVCWILEILLFAPF
jgi:leader peptidase (prepilin peptidase)/N-methyltransferase